MLCLISNVLHLSLHPFMKVWITSAALLSARSLVCSRIISRESLRNNKVTLEKHPFVQHMLDSLNVKAVFFFWIHFSSPSGKSWSCLFSTYFCLESQSDRWLHSRQQPYSGETRKDGFNSDEMLIAAGTINK